MKLVLLLFPAVLAAQEPLWLILHKGASSLGFYSTAGKLLAQTPVGQHPHEMTFSPDGKFAYTTDNGTMRIEQAGTGGNSVSIVDIAARKRIGTIDLGKFRRPHGIDINRATGLLAVSTELPDQLLIVDPVKRAIVKTYDTKGKTSHMVVFGPGGKTAYVQNSSSANVAAIDLATGAVKLLPTCERPEGAVLSRDGKYVYACCREGAKIAIIDTAKNEVAGFIPTSKGPVRIAQAPDGTLVYAAMHDKKIEFADPNTRKVTGSVPLDGTLVSVALSKDGKLAFASAEESDVTFVVSVPERKLVKEVRTAKGAHPDAVATWPR